MTPWKSAAATLSFALLLFGATPVSPGYAAYDKANALFVQTKLPEALAALSLYEEAVGLERSAGELHAETLLPGAKLLLLLGRLEECERWIGEAVKLSPGSRDARFEFARLLLKKGDAAQAAVEGETAL